jgi:hypothetical protein
MKSHLPKCTGPVVKVEKSDEDGSSKNENGLPYMSDGTTDNCGLCLIHQGVCRCGVCRLVRSLSKCK